MGTADKMIVLGFRNESEKPIFRHVISMAHEAYARCGMGPYGGQWDKVWGLVMSNTPDFMTIHLTKTSREDLEEQVEELEEKVKLLEDHIPQEELQELLGIPEMEEDPRLKYRREREEELRKQRDRQKRKKGGKDKG